MDRNKRKIRKKEKEKEKEKKKKKLSHRKIEMSNEGKTYNKLYEINFFLIFSKSRIMCGAHLLT